MAMKSFFITEQLLNQIVAYFGSRPYQEVFQLIQSIQNEVQAQVKPDGTDTNNGQPNAN